MKALTWGHATRKTGVPSPHSFQSGTWPGRVEMLMFLISLDHVVQTLFQADVAKRTGSSSPTKAPLVGWKLYATCSKPRILAWINPACSQGEDFKPGEGNEEDQRLPPLPSTNLIGWGCHSGKFWLAPAPIQWHRDSVQRERQAMSVKGSTALLHKVGDGRELSGVSFIRTLTPFTRVPSSWPNHPRSPYSLILSHWVLGFQHVNFVGTQTFRPQHAIWRTENFKMKKIE